MTEANIKEEWKLIKDSKGYCISSKGRVGKLTNNNQAIKELQACNNNTKKYWRVTIWYKNGIRVTESIHRLVALYFIPNDNPDLKNQVNHKDGNKNNNSVENLEWVSQKENMRHRIDVLGIESWKKGKDCNFTILTEEQVKQIPNLMLNITQTEIARRFNVTKSTISEIVAGRSWSHLKLIFPKKKTTSKYKNIYYREDKKRWGYMITIDKTTIQRCTFDTEEQAYNALKDMLEFRLRYSPNQSESSDTQSNNLSV